VITNFPVKELTLIAQQYAVARSFTPELRVNVRDDMLRDVTIMCVDAIIFGLEKHVDTPVPATAWDHIKQEWILPRPWLRRICESIRGEPMVVRTRTVIYRALFTDLELPKPVRDRFTIRYWADWRYGL
jgi:hypothetical protein